MYNVSSKKCGIFGNENCLICIFLRIICINIDKLCPNLAICFMCLTMLTHLLVGKKSSVSIEVFIWKHSANIIIRMYM